MNAPDLNVKVVVRVRGLWKMAVLNFLMRHKSTRHEIHVHLTDSFDKTSCLTHAEPVHEDPGFNIPPPKTPGLTGQ